MTEIPDDLLDRIEMELHSAWRYYAAQMWGDPETSRVLAVRHELIGAREAAKRAERAQAKEEP